MPKPVFVAAAALCLALSQVAHAQKVQRIGVIYDPRVYSQMLPGLRTGLKESGLAEGRNFVLHVRETSRNPLDVERLAKQLVDERVDVLFTVTTAVSATAQKTTRDVPIVFYVGSDPVREGLAQSFAKPGGRLTGVYHRRVELLPKRMELLRQLLPKARRVIVFYDPSGQVMRSALGVAREAAAKLGIELVERQISSAEEVVAGVRSLRPGEVDAYFLIGDPITTSATPRILPLARERKLPLIVHSIELFDAGALAAYGPNYHDIGQMAARPTKLILGGASPGNIPIETYEKVQLMVNLQVARELGISVPEPVILRADRVVR